MTPQPLTRRATPRSGREPAPLRCAVLCACAVSAITPAWSQGARSTGLSTTLDSSLTYLDSNRDDAQFDGADVITEVRPGLRYSSRSGRVRGSASYGLGLVTHSRGSPSSEAQHHLNATLTGELVERRAFVDVAASINKQSLSAHGQQSVNSNRADNSNLQEVGNVSISPYVTGVLANIATYNLRLNASATNARKSIAGDATTTGGSISLASPNPNARIGWGLTASSSTTDFRASRESTSEQASASINFVPDVDYRLSLRAGRESTDIGSADTQSYSTWGATARWQPSLRTTAEVGVDHRFFGRSHNITLSHRFPLSTLRFSSMRDVSLSGNPNGQPQTLYQQLFEQWAVLVPDPVLRDQVVRALLQGRDPNGPPEGGFVTSGASLHERHEFSWSYGGKRLSLTLQAFATRNGEIGDSSVTPVGDEVRQRGYNGSASYRLTPTMSLGMNGSRLMTQPTALQPGTDLKSLSLNLSEKLGPHMTAALSARYSVFNSAFSPYRESSVTASLGMWF